MCRFLERRECMTVVAPGVLGVIGGDDETSGKECVQRIFIPACPILDWNRVQARIVQIQAFYLITYTYIYIYIDSIDLLRALSHRH